MNRCLKHLLVCPALAALLCLAALPAQAQRTFPQRVERGEITFLTQTQISLNGEQERLAPGARVRDEHNRIPLAGSLRGQTFVVNYLRDPAGKVRDIWLLTPKEAARPAPRARIRAKQLNAPAPQPDPTLHLN
ncbi:MAG: hypothetical protein Q4F13_01145 [Pseudomonadota bacterium]|nr:hypothetical protein [Pseudomonadota bacterium]